MSYLKYLLCLLPLAGWAQSESQLLRQAEKALEKERWAEARTRYEQVLEQNPDQAAARYRLARLLLDRGPKAEALPHAYKAVELTEKPAGEMYLALGEAYHLNYKFDEATEAYQKSDPGNRNKRRITELIEQCENGKKYVANPRRFKITSAGQRVNTPYPEYLPHVTADRRYLYFTSRRPGSTGGQRAADGQPFEDVYVSVNKGGAWEPPQRLAPPLNTNQHDACVGLSPEGQTLFVYKGSNGGDIYISEKKNGQWTRPAPFAHNSEHFESSATLSPDGRRMLFVSDRGGNKNIYVCSRNVGGNWSKPRRLSGSVNTEHDEEAPFLHADGKTLYFSSKGHSTMGGYDIFKVSFNGNNATGAPENLGYPINTPDDDIYFVLSADNKLGYYATVRPEGQGGLDLYTVRMPPSREPGLALLKGTVKDGDSGEPLEALISVTDNAADELVAQFRSDATDGRYLIALPSGRNYGVVIERAGRLFHSENVYLAEGAGFKEVEKAVTLAPIRAGALITLNNVFFDTGRAALRDESKAELRRLVGLMNDNPALRVEIAGHTDNTGNAEANQRLSEARAAAVKAYLTAAGVGADRVETKGYGQTRPVAPNETPAGRQRNRRTEFRVL